MYTSRKANINRCIGVNFLVMGVVANTCSVVGMCTKVFPTLGSVVGMFTTLMSRQCGRVSGHTVTNTLQILYFLCHRQASRLLVRKE